MTKSMAYLMHVDWNWIKQRPHFLAEQLSNRLGLDLFYIRNYKNKTSMSQNEKIGDWRSFQRITKIPFSSRLSALRPLEKWVNHGALKRLYGDRYDFVWITSPIILQFIEIERFAESRIIYDCMDDILAFPQSREITFMLDKLERKLLESADMVFASSSSLRDKMVDRGAKSEVYVVNNAVSSRLLETSISHSASKIRENKLFSIIYFGTVAQWIDFSLLLELLNRHADIEIRLIGPIETKIPEHERLRAEGPVEHYKLPKYTSSADAFIMPFQINELIKSVDPVKVYEYLAFGKPSLIVRYAETMKFDAYVYLYNGIEELSHWISRIKDHGETRAGRDETLAFVSNNTWEHRTAEILNAIR